MEMLDIQSIQAQLGVQLKTPELWWYALSNQGSNGEDPPLSRAQRMLAILGDGVLDLMIMESLVNDRPEDWDRFTIWRDRVVKNATLAKILQETTIVVRMAAAGMNVPRDPKKRGTILEAVFGAVYIDLGFEVSRGLYQRILMPRVPGLIASAWTDNPQLQLGTLVHQVLKGRIGYQLVGTESISGRMVLTVNVTVKLPGRPRLVATGKGSNIDEAKRKAALSALQMLGMPTTEPPASGQSGR